MRILGLVFLYLCLIACNKPNPNPESADEIYLDITSQAGIAKKDFESEKRKLEGFKKALDAVIPQSGEIKYAQKRFFESEKELARLGQQQQFFELKAQTRLRHTKQEYLKAYQQGKPWPTEDEVESYKVYKLLSKVEPSWDSRKRVQTYEKENGIASSVKPKAEVKKKADAKPAEK